MRLKRYKISITVFIVLFILSSCKKPEDMPKPKIECVKIYVDNSASMGGYLDSDHVTEFKEILSDYVYKIEKKVGPVQVYFVNDSLAGPVGAQGFSEQMAKNNIADKDGYQLHDMIKHIINNRSGNEITIFVSDCILSYSNADVKRNPEINRINASTDLKGKIYALFYDLKKSGISTSIYAFKSKFFGTYYDYQNNKTKINGEERPFYVVVLGKKDIVKSFEDNLDNNLSYKAVQVSRYGVSNDIISKYEYIPQLTKRGFLLSNDGSDVKVENNMPFQVVIGIDIKKLADEVKDIRYLYDNLCVKVDGCSLSKSPEIRLTTEDEKKRIKGKNEYKKYESSTHIMVFDVNSVNTKEARINISLPDYKWYESWSCDYDKEYELMKGKTFAFKYFVDGISEAYGENDKKLINFSITLIK